MMTMGVNKTAKRLRGYTIATCKEVIIDEYRHFMATGEQDGVLNLIGPAGIGKTESVYQIAEQMREEGHENCQVVELYLSALMDPESAAGTPIPIDFEYKGEQVKGLSLASRTEILIPMEKGRGPILFIDEMGREADQLRPLIMKLLHEKKLGGLDVSDCFIIVAGNPSDEEHNAVAIQEDAAISSRLCDIPVKPDVKELGKYFYRDKFTQSHRAIADFLMDNPEYMHGRDSDGDQSSKFHSPRSWFNAAAKLHLHGGGTDDEPGNIKTPRVSMVMTGIVGPQAYAHLKNFLSLDKPLSVKDILNGKFRAPVRSVPASTQQALKTWLAEQDVNDAEADNIKDFLEAIPADTARAVMREAAAGNIKTSNNRKLVARGVFKKFLNKITRIKKSGGTTP
jgi:hypothetical protein